jgi:hypothetical protein
LGSEPTPGAFVDSLVRVFRLVRDAMADHAVAFLNVGDTYLHDSRGGKTGGKHGDWHGDPGDGWKVDNRNGLASGNLALIPWRLALALQADGWVVRSVIAWTKPACMPASLSGWRWARHRVKVKGQGRSNSKGVGVGANGRNPDSSRNPELRAEWADCPGCDRCRPNDGLVLRKGSWRPTSSWEPIILLAKSASYFMDGEAVRTPSAPATVGRDRYTRVLDDPDEQFAVKHDHERTAAGANLRDVWRTDLDDLTREELVGLVRQLQGADMPDRLSVAAEPLHEPHYAAFPSALVRKCLLAGTSARGYCPACGMPWCRVMETPAVGCTRHRREDHPHAGGASRPRPTKEVNATLAEYKTIGWRPSCPCSPVREPRPAVVLDPFCGAGRTGCAARQLGLDFVGVELDARSVEIARRQIDNALRETKRQRPKPGAGLFDGLAAPGPAAGGVGDRPGPGGGPVP